MLPSKGRRLVLAFLMGVASCWLWLRIAGYGPPLTSISRDEIKQDQCIRSPSSSSSLFSGPADPLPTMDSIHLNNNNINIDHKRINAAYVILCREKDLHEMRKTMRNLEQVFNRHHQYPYIFLNEVPFSEHFKTHISAMTTATVQFGLVPEEHWSYPDSINQTQAALNRQEMEDRNVPYGESESYRHMCRYESGFIFHHPLVLPLDYYWRVEPGVSFSCDMADMIDPFLYMQSHKIKYGFTIALPEYVNTIPTLWETVQGFQAQYPQHISSKNSLEWISYDKGQTYNNCHFWTNFEIVDTSFVRSKAYTDYFEWLDRTGGFFYERWGDAPVRSIAAALMLERREIYFFNEIGYRHAIYEHCPESPRLQLKCACDPADNVDWAPFSCLKRFLET